MHELSQADGPSINAPASAFLAQTRTLGATSTTVDRRFRAQTKHSKDAKARQEGIDSGNNYTLIEPRSGSSSGWALQDDEALESRRSISETQPTGSTKLQEWRAKWPVIEMLEDFERDQWQTHWFGPLLIVVVVVLFALSTVIGLLLLVIGRL